MFRWIGKTGMFRIAISLALVCGMAVAEPVVPVAPALIELDRRSDGIAASDPTPLLRIYADGLVLVHYPVYMKRAGTWSMQLDAGALQTLLSELEDKGLFALQPEQLDRQIGQAMAMRAKRSGQVHYRSETLTSRFGLHAAKSVSLGWRIANLQHLAEKLPAVSALQDLAAAERRLLALTDHPDLERIGPAPTAPSTGDVR